MDGQKRASPVDQKPKSSDSEKITINLGLIDLGQIDLLVHEGSTPIGLTSFARQSEIT
jgi:hypothetical protein